MSEPITHKHEIVFQAFRGADGQPFITLSLSQEGKLLPPKEGLFFLELVPGTSFEGAKQLVDALRLAMTHLGVTLPSEPTDAAPDARPSS